ncbi:MAG: Wzz/FepE/Etk N-terminal domain-containing protein [Hyphomicrobiaceae bacterium]
MAEQFDSTGVSEAPASGLPTIADALRLLRRRARFIAGVALIGAACGYGVGLLMTPAYEATATVEIDTRRTNISDIRDVVSQLDPDSPTIDSQIEIIRSARIIGRVVADLQLAEDPEFQPGPGWRTTIRTKLDRLLGTRREPTAGEPKTAASVDLDEADVAAVQILRSRVSAERVGGSFLIEIAVRSEDAEKAQAIANAVAEAYVAEQVEVKTDRAKQATLWLDKQAEEMKQKVVEAERLVEAYKIENGLQSTEGHPLDERELTRTAEQLIVARADTAGALARYQQVEGLSATAEGQETIASVLENNTITALKEELARVARRHAELSTRYGELHPEMIKAQAELRDARHQLSAEVQKLVTNLRNEYEVARGRQESLEADLEQQKTAANVTSEASVRLRELMREADAARLVYEGLAKRAAETRQQESLQVADSRVVNPAVTPFSPVAPKKLKLALIGFGAGFLLTFGASAVLELLWPTFVRPQEIEARLRLRHLASIPGLRTGGDRQPAGLLAGIRSIVAEPHTPFAESVRSVRIAIDNERRDAAEVVLIASALPGDGKTVIASNLAHLYAMSGVKTLLVDADLRKGMLSRQLVPEAELGLLDALQAGRSPLEAIVTDRESGLHFLPATGMDASRLSAPELLASRRTAEIFSQLRREFEVIIVDAPPAMPVVDARIIADHADQVVLVSRWKRTPAALVKRSGELLALSGATLTGLVINDVDAAAMPSDDAYVLRGYGDMERLSRAA